MAFRYLIYSTGTTYSGTIVRESATNNPGVNEASLYSEFIIPEIQPLYLWRVTGGVSVVPNTDSNINNYEDAVAPAPTPDDSITYGEVTGITNTKIDKVTGATGKIPLFIADGNLNSSGYSPAELIASGSGVTQVQFNQYTGVTAPAQFANKAAVNYYTGTTAPATYANKSVFNGYTGTTAPILAKALTGVTNLGTGSTLGGLSARNLTIKSISGIGGVKITTNANSIIISGETNVVTTWGNITGTLSNQTDLQNALDLKLDRGIFGMYTGTTAPATYLSKSSFATYSGTTVPNTYYNKTQINSYTGQTATLINSKVAKVTGATANNIATFVAGGAIQDSGKDFITTVNTVGVATNAHIPTELAVRNAINQAINAAIILQGDWNAATNVPNLQVTGITTGYAWRVSVSGTTSLGGLTPWYVGDMAVKSASGWIKIANQDIAAIWGNISGNIANQTDLVNALAAKLNNSTFATYTGTTVPNTYLSKSTFATYSGTTVPNTYYNKTEINSYTGKTDTLIGTKLPIATFTGYTASTKNVNKKIQVISTLTSNANVVTPLAITWNSASPYANDMYTWSGGSGVFIKSAGTYEVQYHVLLKNNAVNQTHSIGGYVIKNNSTTLINTATAGMVVGANASGELSLPPVVQTFAVNDRLDLAVFRIGSAGTVNLVSGSVFMTLNKLS